MIQSWNLYYDNGIALHYDNIFALLAELCYFRIMKLYN